jgi:hypothetical protein
VDCPAASGGGHAGAVRAVRYVGNYSEGRLHSEGRLPGVTTSPGRDTDIGGCEP